MRRELTIVAMFLALVAAAQADVPDSYIGPIASFGFPEPGPSGVAVAPDGSFYVTIRNDVERHDASGALVETWPGAAPGAGAITLDPAGHVYVADPQADVVRKFGPGGALLDTWTGFDLPADLAAGPSGVLVEDRGSELYYRQLQLRSPDGDLLATREVIQSIMPGGAIAQGPDGGLWLRSDLLVERLDPTNLSTVAEFSHDATDRERELRGPRLFRCCGIAVSEGFVWVGDTMGRIERYSTSGAFTGACEDVSGISYGTPVAAGPGDSVYEIRLGAIVRYATVARPAPGCDVSAPFYGDVRVHSEEKWRGRRIRRRYAVVSFLLSEPADVTMRFIRLRKGVGPRPRGGRTFAAERGLLEVRFPRAPGTLRRGVYRVTLSATDQRGNRGKTWRRLRVY
jgi:hypothetical protein